jgi:hypothetical protein
VNAVVFALARLADIDFTVPEFGSAGTVTEITVGHVIGASLVGLVVAWLALAATRFRRPAAKAVTVIGAVLAVASAGAPLSLDADGGTRIILAAMHLMVGVAFVYGAGTLTGKHRS